MINGSGSTTPPAGDAVSDALQDLALHVGRATRRKVIATTIAVRTEMVRHDVALRRADEYDEALKRVEAADAMRHERSAAALKEKLEAAAERKAARTKRAALLLNRLPNAQPIAADSSKRTAIHRAISSAPDVDRGVEAGSSTNRVTTVKALRRSPKHEVTGTAQPSRSRVASPAYVTPPCPPGHVVLQPYASWEKLVEAVTRVELATRPTSAVGSIASQSRVDSVNESAVDGAGPKHRLLDRISGRSVDHSFNALQRLAVAAAAKRDAQVLERTTDKAAEHATRCRSAQERRDAALDRCIAVRHVAQHRLEEKVFRR